MEDNLDIYSLDLIHETRIGDGENLNFSTAAKFTSFIITPYRPRNNKSIKFDIGRRDGRLIGKKIPSTG